MKILAIGDVVGKPGRQAVKHFVGKMKKKKEVDFVIANGENSAGGSGYTDKTADELFDAGVDVITSGDHVFKKKDILSYITKENKLLRPANFPDGVPGCGYIVLPFGDEDKIAVVNILGRVFLKPLKCPFKTMESLLKDIREITPNIIVDFHAEATSEKIAMGWFLDGKISALVGTHTHVQTADEIILPKGTAFITDLGMTGPINSVLGRDIDKVLEHFLTGMPAKFSMAKDNIQLQGVIIDLDEKTGKSRDIKRIKLKLDEAS
jgi:hypothetical protein